MRRRRALFYRSLVPVPAVAARIPDTRGHTCVHYRAFGGSVDTANGQIFAATRNLAPRFTTLIAAMPPGLPLFVASSSAEVTRSMLAAALRRGGGGAPAAVAVPGSAQADDADPRAVFVAEWLALGPLVAGLSGLAAWPLWLRAAGLSAAEPLARGFSLGAVSHLAVVVALTAGGEAAAAEAAALGFFFLGTARCVLLEVPCYRDLVVAACKCGAGRDDDNDD